MSGDGFLELSTEEMRRLGYHVIDLIVDHFTRVSDVPIIHTDDPPAMERLLREPAPEEKSDPIAIADRVRSQVLAYSGQLIHPRFFGFIPSPSNFVSVMAETLATGFNVFVGSWRVSSGPSEVELVTIDWLRQMCGLPEGAGGLFVGGGSQANLTALAVMRHIKGMGCVYGSDQTHSSVQRDLQVLGFADELFRVIPSDDQFRLTPEGVRQTIGADRAAGKQPVCVIANAGTTNTGAVDPLDELAELCRDEDIWLHVDGAYGAPAMLTEEGRALLKGMELADSLTLDPHKWLFQPFEIGCVLVRDRRLLPEVFATHPSYMKDVDRGEEEVNFRDYGIQLTRNFRALKLWMSIQVFGLEAFRSAVVRGMELARVAERALRAADAWEIVTPAQLAMISFRYTAPGLSPEVLDEINSHIVDAAMDDGFALVTSTVLRGRTVLRLCTINPRTTEDDIRETVRRLEEYGNILAAATTRQM